MTISRVATIAKSIKQEISATELRRLRVLLDLPHSATIEAIAEGMTLLQLNMRSIRWYLDLDTTPLPPPVHTTIYDQLRNGFTGQEISVIYTKLGFELGYQPVTLRMDAIAQVAERRNYDIAFLRELCDTRREEYD